MPQRWAIRLAVEGDLRFLSHHDMMRAIERTAVRAHLPLRYSQGFNPRPVMSLVCPRPVGVASLDDLLAVALDEPWASQEVLDRLNRAAPPGLRFVQAQELASAKSPQFRRIRYELPLEPSRHGDLARRIRELEAQDAWPIERQTQTDRRGATRTQAVDLRPMVQLDLGPAGLTITLTPQGAQWARPGEVLGLLGLAQRADLANLVRTNVDYEMNHV